MSSQPMPSCARVVSFSLIFCLLIIAIMKDGAAEPAAAKYLLFQIFAGGPEHVNGEYRPDQDVAKAVQRIVDTVRPPQGDPNRILGFAIGPIAMDRGEDAKAVIRRAFDIALETNLAVMLHLDDYMFWEQARWPDGRLLRSIQGTTEWKDWSGAPAGSLDIGWLPNIKLAPQMCYENPEVKSFVAYWTRDVIGQEVKRQVDRLIRAGKLKLFAGITAGWESNMHYGYCSLSQLGYSAQRPPVDFDHERESILQRHIERWSKGLHDAGIAKELIFTHVAFMPKSDYERVSARVPRFKLREVPGSASFRALWAAFNPYSNPGFSAYPDKDERFADIYEAVRNSGRKSWAMVEGTNAIPSQEGASQSPLSWETYLARSFNHGATMVNLFGGFQGATDEFGRSTESAQALEAYRKFLRGDRLIEEPAR
jgi:hypothetical protein